MLVPKAANKGSEPISTDAALRPNGRNLRISTFGEACALSREQGSSAAPLPTLREAGRLMEGTRPGWYVLWALAPIGYCVRLFKNCCRIELDTRKNPMNFVLYDGPSMMVPVF